MFTCKVATGTSNEVPAMVDEDALARKLNASVEKATQALPDNAPTTASSAPPPISTTAVEPPEGAVTTTTTTTTTPPPGDDSTALGTIRSHRGADDASGVEPRPAVELLPFFTGNPTVEVVHGVLHLYRTVAGTTESHKPSAPRLPEERSRLLCALGIPASFSCADFCTFVAPYEEHLTHLRIIRDNAPAKYMVLLKFKTQDAADQFYLDYHGHPFTSLEPDVCTLLFADAVYFEEAVTSPPEGQVELPACPVCLERLDATVSGLLTILCNHTFHSRCLSKWTDNTCPVCRFVQSPVEEEQVCEVCGRQDNLWICLICGNVACGRYEQAHARKHYEQTKHTYALELGTQRVWDYAGDGYVHRLLSNMSDGKLVELGKPDQCDDSHDEKPEAIMMEYNYILVTQLETQRIYFEEKLEMQQRAHEQRLEQADKFIAELQQQAAEAAEREALMDRRVKQLNKQVEAAAKKAARDEEELSFLREVNANLQRNQTTLNAQLTSELAKRDATIADLQEQVRDLMVYLDTQRAVQASPQRSELEGGTVVLQQQPPSTAAQQRRRKKR